MQEIETTKASLKSKTEEIKSIFSNSESHEKEFAKLHKKIETQQEEIKSQETKVKWAQNKLTAELEAHKVKILTLGNEELNGCITRKLHILLLIVFFRTRACRKK